MRFNFSLPFQYVFLHSGSEKKQTYQREGLYPDIKPNSFNSILIQSGESAEWILNHFLVTA